MTDHLTHRQILLRELAQHGKVTYHELLTRYPDHDYVGFTQAALRLEQRGVLTRPEHHGGPLVAVGACPCCGRRLEGV